MRGAMRVGSDAPALCRKCGETWHVVIALAHGAVAQVECGECGARHKYRPPKGLGVGGDGGTVRKPALVRAASARSASARRKAAAKAGAVEADPSKPVRPFRVSDRYEVGDRIAHASFGEGVVQAVAGPTKVEVLFPAGSKILVHGRG